MTPPRCHRGPMLIPLSAGLLAALFSSALSAQAAWPTKPVRIVAPLAAGGGGDALARHLAEALGRKLGQPVIVENKVGVGGNLGTDAVAKSAPDGHTLLLTGPAPIAQAMALYKKLPYNPQTDLTLVSDIAQPRVVCAVNPAVPVKTIGEVLAWGKAHPGKLTFGTWGVGTQPQMVQALFDRNYGAQTINVPYKGEAPVIVNLLGGQLAMGCANASSVKPHVASGKLRAIATLGPTRAAAMPEVPTFAETGYKDDVLQLTGPLTLIAPAGTPQHIIARLGREVAELVRSAEMTQKIEALGMEPVGNLPADALAGYNARLPILLKAVRDTGVTID